MKPLGELVKMHGSEKMVDALTNDIPHLLGLVPSSYAHQCGVLYIEAAKLIKEEKFNELSIIEEKIRDIVHYVKYWD